ncbi:MAG: hypothetical protein WD066_08970 [Planctomycetaceae bacterium]
MRITGASMASLCVALAALIVVGCSYETSAVKSPEDPQKTAETNTTPPAESGGSQRVSRIGSAVGLAPLPDDRPAAAPSQAPAASSESPAPPKTIPPPRREGTILTDRTREIMDYPQALAAGYRPAPGQEGVDVLTQLGTVGVRVGSFAGSLPVKQWLNQQKAVEGRYPTHAELMKWMEDNPGFELPSRYPYESYAYDGTTGQFVVVEHPESKAQYLKDRGVE